MIGWMLQNGITAAVLAGLIWAVCRWGRLGPAMRHALWLLVLIKLVMPPVATWPWAVANPAGRVQAADGREMGTVELLRSLLREEPTGGARRDGTTAGTGAAAAAGAPGRIPAAPVVAPAGEGSKNVAVERMSWHWTKERGLAVVMALWLAGTAAYGLVQGVRIVRMMRRASGAKPVAALEQAVAEEARKLGMPPVRVREVDDGGGPYVWSLGRPVLLWPVGLSPATAAGRAMLVHELAHVRRRDHWVGWLRLTAGCVWWWHPAYWWACRRLQEEAELACDGWAVQKVARARRAYAKALLEVCEKTVRPVPPLPALAVGVTDGGTRILERRLRMIMRENVTLRLSRAGLAALGMLALALAPGWAQSVPATGRARFTVSKETTVITEPLNADGTPDYAGALNALNSAGVTPENNGFTLWIEIVGTRVEDGQLSAKTRERAMTMVGAKETPAGAEVWKTYYEYLDQTKHLSQKRVDALQDEMNRLRLELWTATDHPEFADYLKANEPWLKKIAEAAARPKWWWPTVSGGGNERQVMISTLLPSLGKLREAAYTIGGRATLRGAAGDFEGFMQDVVTVKRLGRHLSHGMTLIEKLVGAGINRVADEAVATVAGSGKLSAGQCQALSDAIRAVPERTPMEDGINKAERWMMLDTVLWSMTAEDTRWLKSVLGGDSDQAVAETKFGSVELPELDLDIILRKANESYDSLTAGGSGRSLAEVRKQAAALEAKQIDWVKEFNGSTDLRKRANETREAYSARVGRVFMSRMLPSLGKAFEADREDVMRDEAVRVLLAAAGEKARTGNWPATLQEMVPGALKEVPVDWFSANGKDPLKYEVTSAGARVYSVGRNGRGGGANPAPPPATAGGLP
jgi:beta-lactamase regulating signal transducer with metallopeptidase domain